MTLVPSLENDVCADVMVLTYEHLSDTFISPIADHYYAFSNGSGDIVANADLKGPGN